jgi:hypothetical protein
VSRGEDDRDIDSFFEILYRGADSSPEEDSFFLADQKDFSMKLKFEEVFDNDSGEVVRVL